MSYFSPSISPIAMASQSHLAFLPPELEREIVESAANVHPETVPNLFLVSRRFHDWVERIRYRTVTPDGELSTYRLFALQRAIRSHAKPASFFRDRVRHLFVRDLSVDELEEIFLVCDGVQSLTIGWPTPPRPIPGLTATRPRRLNVILDDLLFVYMGMPLPPLPHPMFTLVTHLNMFDHRLDKAEILNHLTLFPVLSHLATWYDTTSPTDLLARHTKLEALIYSSGLFTMQERSSEDSRVVYMNVYKDYMQDWIGGTLGGLDFWARADIFIAKKRRGEIQPTSRCWIEEADGIGS
ncbi:hypothetical protein DFH06DRAFT_254313 [Mycena polygramma]|nr:hypothetical protein DFH06DRAFT_254313 [Mycena polygramma]